MKQFKKPVGKAPYNFVPLPERIISRYDSVDDLPTHDASKEADRHLLSGEITFNIVAENPILVADKADPNEPRKFIKNADGTYEIPGSSLRGVIRNAVSVLSLSDWTEQMDDEKFYYRSVAESRSKIGKHYKSVLDVKVQKVNDKQEAVPCNVKAGFIAKTKDGKYCIYQAKSDEGRHGKTYYKVNDGNLGMNKEKFRSNVSKGFIIEDVTFSLSNNGKVVKMYQKDASFKGHLLFSGFIRTGKTKKVSAYLINEIDKDKPPIPLKDVKAYNADLKFRSTKFPRHSRERMEKFFELPTKPGIEHAKPCFYLEYDGVTYFGFTAFLRLLFPYSTRDLLPEYILNKNDGIDYMSALFGFTNNSIHSKHKANYASRLHFHGAKVKNHVDPLKPVYIQPGSPRASAYRFYLKQDDQNSDYYTYLTKDTTIRGMKQYWIKDEDLPQVDRKKKNTLSQLQFLPKHTTFQAKITFDQLHEDELGLLLWALKGPKYHQIGGGKPYGYGVVSFEMLKCFIMKNENMYKDITNLFQIEKQQIDIDVYIEKYKNYAINILKKDGYPADDHFKIEDLESIHTFLAMKEKSKLPVAQMRYVDKNQYSKVNLPSAQQLLKMEDAIYKQTATKNMSQNPSVNKTQRENVQRPHYQQNKSQKQHKNEKRNRNKGGFTNPMLAEQLKKKYKFK